LVLSRQRLKKMTMEDVKKTSFISEPRENGKI
jgi:hypothetical protein